MTDGEKSEKRNSLDTTERETCQGGGGSPRCQVTQKELSRIKAENRPLGLTVDQEEKSFNRRQKAGGRDHRMGQGTRHSGCSLFHTIGLRRGRVGDTVVRGRLRSARSSLPLGEEKLVFLIYGKASWRAILNVTVIADTAG